MIIPNWMRRLNPVPGRAPQADDPGTPAVPARREQTVPLVWRGHVQTRRTGLAGRVVPTQR